MFLYVKMICYSPTSIASNFFNSLWNFSTTFRRRRNLLFQFRLQIYRRRVGIFSHFFLCCLYFLLKVLIFLQFSIGTRAEVRSSRHRPFCFNNNFCFLLKLFCIRLFDVGIYGSGSHLRPPCTLGVEFFLQIESRFCPSRIATLAFLMATAEMH